MEKSLNEKDDPVAEYYILMCDSSKDLFTHVDDDAIISLRLHVLILFSPCLKQNES